ncbi:glycoside hydrolase [Mucidula mucida]|nr:glycoside hydrolase [Mucidula mucida]
MASVGSRGSRYLEEKRAAYAPPRSKRKVIIGCGILAGILLILAIVIPVYFAVVKPNNKNSNNNGDSDGDSNGSEAPSATSTGKPTSVLVTGGSGSKVTTDDGTTFTYKNDFGGIWYHDPQDPWHNGARAQSWSPALNETFKYGVDKIRGVNIGGWLTIEPPLIFLYSPALFEPFGTEAVDEYTLHTLIKAQDGNWDKIEEHYKTFITEQDFANIAAAGLNFVRIPIPYWAIEVREGEPFFPKVAWTYFLKGIEWARKYGIRINLDFHALPGSQNGWNHSGKLGTVNFLNGPMGYANAQRSLDYIRIIAEFISQPQYRDVVVLFGIANEVQGSTVGKEQVQAFYLQAYEIVRNAGGTGEGNGPWVGFHDAFFGRDDWSGFLAGGDRMTLDSHPYIAFGGQSAAAMSSFATTPCDNWGAGVNGTMADFGFANAGEWSNAVSDCGLFLNGVGLGTRYEGNYTEATTAVGSCEPLLDWENWDDTMKAAVKQFAMASMDALQNWFFWTWKIGESTEWGTVRSPAWSYSLGLANGWMPEDPREAVGVCGNTAPFQGSLAAWQTGGAGAGTITAATGDIAWPPATISNGGAVTDLPSYTPTGSVPTLTADSAISKAATATKVSLGNGWNNPDDKAGLMTDIASCSYLDPWVGPTAAPPSPLCS